MKKLFSFLLSASFLFLTQCQTGPKISDDGSDRGVWEGKVRMVDKIRNKKMWGYVQWYSDSPEGRLRVDVNAIFGISIATFIMDSSGARLWLHQENRYIVSDDPKKLFSRLVKFDLDPSVFFALLRSRPQLNASWSCMNKPGGLSCLGEANKKGQRIGLQLKNRAENKREIGIHVGQKSVNFVMERSKVQVPEQIFSQKKSLGYKKIKI